MNKVEPQQLKYNDLPSFFKQKLWNNKTLTFTISRDKIDDDHVEIKFTQNEKNNTKSPK